MKQLILALVLAAGLCACRRTDVREMTVELPGLNATNQAVVVEALAKYNGVDKSSYRWDLEKKTLTLKYDSMQIAQANIRYAIDERGVKVAFPVKTDDRAGH